MSIRTWRWPAGIPKSEWGPRGWTWLHLLAINYAPNPTRVEGRATFRRIWNFVSHLPCDECRMHAMRYVIGNPPDLASTHSLQRWAWSFHNRVNRRLGKPVVPYDEYQRYYSEEIRLAGA